MRFPRAETLVFALLVAACSGRDLVIGGDPERQPATSAGVGGTGGVESAGTGGTAGDAPAGTAGTSILPSGGTAGTTTSDDPYPPVAWEDGSGYRTSCPSVGDTWGFTCWSLSTVATSCDTDGDPACNACSCAVPCEMDEDCPLGVHGEAAVCAGSSTTVKSCFISCESADCPTGMNCSDYPGGSARVCMWVDPVINHGTPK